MAKAQVSNQSLLIPTYYLQQVFDQLQAYPEKLEQLTQHYGLSFDNISKANSLISLGTFKEIIHQAIHITEKPSLGLIVGQQLNVTTHGMLGFAIMASRNIREALALIEKYLNIRTPLLEIKLIEAERNIEVRLYERYQLGDIKRPLLESVASALYTMLNHIAGELSPVASICFDFEKPAYCSEYQEFFDCEVDFSQSNTALILDKGSLDTALKMGNADALNNALQICDKELLEVRAGQTVQHKIRMILLSEEQQFPNLRKVAETLHLSTRTMHRHLEKEDTCFSEILGEIRALRSQKLLKSTRLTVSEIAHQLGYSDSASFRKAFKSWLGMSPKAFRQSLEKTD